MSAAGQLNSAPAGDDDIALLIAQARGAWVQAGGLEAEVSAPPPRAPPPPPPKKSPPRPLDIPTALDWYDEVLRYRADNPKPATRAEIAHIWELMRGRYAPTKFPLPLDDMAALDLSPGQWRDVFVRADKWLLKKGAPNGTPPPYPLFFKIAQNHTEYRKKIARKEAQLNQARRAHRHAPSEYGE